MKRAPIIALIGRPNVGKSTLFNRLMRNSMLAMAHDQPGVTRDRHYGILDLDEGTEGERELVLVDTGGFYPDRVEIDPKIKNNVDPFFNIMADHARLAIRESDLVLLVVDVREGLNPFDEGIFTYIRSQKKPVWILANKHDSDKQEGEEAEFYRLGLDGDDLFAVSAEHNRGLGELRTRLWDFAGTFASDGRADGEEILQKGVKPAHDVVAAVAIVGAPNAGKSTLLNALVGAQRALVSEIAGTTVDPIEGYIDLFFGDEAEAMSAQRNRFRRDNATLIEEMEEFAVNHGLADEEVDEDGVNDSVYLEFGQTAPEWAGPVEEDEVKEEKGNDHFESEDKVADFDLQEYFGDAALEASLTRETVVEDVELRQARAGATQGLRSIKLVDTAGIRRAKKVEGFIEEQSVYRSLRAITGADVVVFMIDATLGITHQDRRLLDIALEKGKSLIICLNKIDLLQPIFADQRKKKEWIEELKYKIPWLEFCQLVTISAIQGRNLGFLKGVLRQTIQTRHRRIPTGQLNKSVTGLVERHPVVVRKTGGVRFRVKYASMIKSAPPTFLLFTNKSQGIPETYRRYLVNGLRREFNLANTPVHLIFRTTGDLKQRMKKIESKKIKAFTKT